MKKWLSVVLALSMLFSLCASTVWATEGSGSSAPDVPVVNGYYDANGQWKQGGTGTVTTDDGLTLSKTAEKTGENEYKITLKVVSSSETTTAAADAATVLVIDCSNSMGTVLKQCSLQEHTHKQDCYERCTKDSNPSHWKWEAKGKKGHWVHIDGTTCTTNKKGDKYYSDTLTCTKQEHTHSSLCQSNRLDAAKAAAKTFIDNYKVASSGTNSTKRYVSIVGFGTTANWISSWYDVSTDDGYNKAVNYITNTLKVGNGTNLDDGLRKAKSQLEDGTVKNIQSKNVVALTDGEPTYYGSGKDVSGHGSAGCPNTNAATIASATALKSAGATVYTVCFGAENELTYTQNGSNKNHPHDGNAPTVGNFLSGSIATAADKAFNASTAAELNKAFSDISTSVTSGLGSGDGWTVTDPMPGYINVTGVLPADMEKTGNNNTYTWTLGNGEEKTENGKTTYTYTTSYTVTVNDKAGLDETKYHPTNKVTTLHYGANNSQTAYFPVPGVKVVNAAYIIIYDKGEHGALYEVGSDAAVSQITFENQKHGTATPKLDEPTQVKADDGWYFVGWKPEVAPTVTGHAIYVAQYAAMGTVVVKPNNVETYYDGEVHNPNGYTTKGLPEGYQLSDAPVLSGSRKNAGQETITADINGINVLDENGNLTNYTVSADTGLLIIRKLPITLTSETAEKVYDGEELTRPNVTVGSDVRGGADLFEKEINAWTGVSVTNVFEGTRTNLIQYHKKSDLYDVNNYEITLKEGSLRITPLEVTLTSGDASKVYDGTPLTNPDSILAKSNNGDILAFLNKVTDLKATGTITEVGSTPNTIAYKEDTENGFHAKNYTITLDPGLLTITEKEITPGAPDVTVTKTVDKATTKRGDTLTYTITVTNNSKEDLANLTLKDVMFNDKTQKTDTTTSWTKVIDKLEAGKSQTFTYTYKVVRDDVNTKVINVVTVTDGGQLSVTAQATTSVTGGGNGGNGGGTSTDTKTPVKSSSTGDMGIALYGAMALLSAGGMVWAGKKRRDER